MRPLGVVLVGFYQIVRGVLGILFGLSLLFFADLAGKLSYFAIEAKAAGRFFAGFGTLAAVVVIVFAIFCNDRITKRKQKIGALFFTYGKIPMFYESYRHQETLPCTDL